MILGQWVSGDCLRVNHRPGIHRCQLESMRCRAWYESRLKNVAVVLQCGLYLSCICIRPNPRSCGLYFIYYYMRLCTHIQIHIYGEPVTTSRPSSHTRNNIIIYSVCAVCDCIYLRVIIIMYSPRCYMCMYTTCILHYRYANFFFFFYHWLAN